MYNCVRLLDYKLALFILLLSQKIGAIAFLVSGWTLVVYTIREAWDSLLSSEYREYIIAYFTVAGILSFVICYWYGPVKNERTIHILEGALYLMAVLLMYGGIQHKPTAVAIIALLGSITYLKRKGVLPSRLPQFHWRWWVQLMSSFDLCNSVLFHINYVINILRTKKLKNHINLFPKNERFVLFNRKWNSKMINGFVCAHWQEEETLSSGQETSADQWGIWTAGYRGNKEGSGTVKRLL